MKPLHNNKLLTDVVKQIFYYADSLCVLEYNVHGVDSYIIECGKTFYLFDIDFYYWDVPERVLCNAYVLFVNDEDALEDTLSTGSEKHLLNSHSTLLIITNKNISVYADLFFEYCWKNDVNILVLETMKQPLSPFNTSEYFLDFNKFSLYSVMERKTITNITKNVWTPKKMHQILKNEIIVLAAMYPPLVTKINGEMTGAEVEILKLATPGWTINYQIPENKNNLTHYYFLRKYISSIRDGYLDIDLGIGGFWMTHYYQCSYPYYTHCKTFLVHKPKLLPTYSFQFQYFHLLTWLLYFSMILCISLFLKISSCNGWRKETYSFYNSIFTTVRFAASQPIPKLPTQNKLSLRLLLLTWLIVSLLFTTYFGAALQMALRIPRYQKTINNAEDMVKENIKWFDDSYLTKELLELSGDEFFGKLSKLFVFDRNKSRINLEMRKGKYAIPTNILADTLLSGTETLDDYGKNNLKVIRCLAKWFNAFAYPKNSPLSDYFNLKVMHITEYGFPGYWLRYFIVNKDVLFMSKFFVKQTSETFQYLTFERFHGSFLFLLTGIAMAIISFGIELYV
ncbi:hypothetical protein HHI36_007254 [Cryptolaemus montrouzieri]|uniref:Ionotropic glutamate receptor C-terminal domain-containing protein n=1 Tax=Cryptolaemus montrouzieri TaxID=559131 RepID=A0ABD2MP49_9CUCU